MGVQSKEMNLLFAFKEKPPPDIPGLVYTSDFVGHGIVGVTTGVELERLSARVTPFTEFKHSYPA